MSRLMILFVLIAAGCCAPPQQPPMHVVVPDGKGGAQVQHLRPGYYIDRHGCDSSSVYRP